MADGTSGSTGYPGILDAAWSHVPARHACCPLGPVGLSDVGQVFLDRPFTFENWAIVLTAFGTRDPEDEATLIKLFLESNPDPPPDHIVGELDLGAASAFAEKREEQYDPGPGNYVDLFQAKAAFKLAFGLTPPWRAIDGASITMTYRLITYTYELDAETGYWITSPLPDPEYGEWIEVTVTPGVGDTVAKSDFIALPLPADGKRVEVGLGEAIATQTCLGA